EIDYRSAAKLGDRLVIDGWLDQVARARFWCAFRITRPEDSTLIAQCRQMLALIEMPAGKLLRLPEHWQEYRKAGIYPEGECQTAGQYAGAAREMVEAHRWLLPTNDGIPRLQKPPLLYWLIILSFKLFGVSAAAARLPGALATVASVALIFLIGEKLTDYWRG